MGMMGCALPVRNVMKLSCAPLRTSRSELNDVRYCNRGSSGAGGKKLYFGPVSFFCVAQPVARTSTTAERKVRKPRLKIPAMSAPKAALKPPHSKRFAQFLGAWQPRQRLECGGFSAAFRMEFVSVYHG